jgi:exopolysaccharide production protein ExoQ
VTTGEPAQLTLAPRSASDARVSGQRVPRPEVVFAWFGLFVSTGGLIPVVQPLLGFQTRGEDLGGDPFAQGIWAVVYGVSAILLFVRLPRVIRTMPALGTIWVIVAMALASPLWSAAPEVSTRRGIALLGTTVFALYLVARFTSDQIFRVLFSAFVVVVPLSMVCGLLRFGVPPGDWQGSFSSKNLLGQAMVLSTVISLLFALSESGWRRVLGAVTTLFSIALLLLSDSKTSVVVLFASLLLLLPLRVLRLRHRVAELAVTATLVGAGSLAVWIAGNSGSVLNLLQRDATLTGRVPLWEMLWEMIQRKPWMGYGYGGFWLYWHGPSAAIWEACMARYGWLPPNGHDGFIDLWLDLGAIGLLAFTARLILSLVRATRMAQQGRSFADLFPIVFLYSMVLGNLTQSALVAHNSLIWILFVTISTHLSWGGEDRLPTRTPGD